MANHQGAAFDSVVKKISSYLQSFQHVIVAVYLDDNKWFLPVQIAALNSQVTLMPLDPRNSVEFNRSRIEQHQISIIIADTNHNLMSSVDSIICIEAGLMLYQKISQNILKKNDSLYLLHTSGTTGQPKPVFLTKQALFHRIEYLNRLLNFTKDSLFINPFNHCFDGGVFSNLLGYYLQLQLIIPPRERLLDCEYWNILFSHSAPNHIFATPSLLDFLVNHTQFTSQPWVNVLYGGEPINLPLAKKLYGSSQCLVNLYGPTEATVFVTAHILEQPEDNTCLGKLIPGIKQCSTYKVNDIKELVIEGVGCPNQYHTGDLVELDTNGCWHYYGRQDHLVKRHGQRVNLSELEVLASQVTCVATAVAIYNKSSDELILFIVPTFQEEVDTIVLSDNIYTVLAKSLPKYVQPEHIKFIQKIPLTHNGKVDQKKLLQSLDRKNTVLDCSTHYIDWLRDYFANPNIQDNDSFFKFGSDSLSALAMANDFANTSAGCCFDLHTILSGAPISRWLLTKASTMVSTLSTKSCLLNPGQFAIFAAEKQAKRGIFNQIFHFRFDFKLEKNALITSIMQIFRAFPHLMATLTFSHTEAKLDFSNNIHPQQWLITCDENQDIAAIIAKSQAELFDEDATCLFKIYYQGRHNSTEIIIVFSHLIVDFIVLQSIFKYWKHSLLYRSAIAIERNYQTLATLPEQTACFNTSLPGSITKIINQPFNYRLSLPHSIALTKQFSHTTIIITLFAALVCRVKQQSDIVIGAPILCYPLDVSTPGSSVTIAPINFIGIGHKTLLENLADCQQQFAKLSANPRWFTPENNTIPIVISVRDSLPSLPGCTISEHHHSIADAYGLYIEVISNQDDYNIHISSSRLDTVGMQWLETLCPSIVDHLNTIAESTKTVEDIIFNPPKQEQLLPIQQDLPLTLELLLTQIQQQTNTHFAIIDVNGQVTYQEFWQHASQKAVWLQQQGVLPKGLVAIALPSSIDCLEWLLASWLCGAAYVPIDQSTPSKRRQELLGLINPDIFINTPPQWQHLAPAENFYMPKANDLAYIIFTSGTTGTPKGVQISHANLGYLLAATRDLFAWRSSDRWCMLHSTAFDFSVWEIWRPLTLGHSLYIPNDEIRYDAGQLWHYIAQHNITWLNQTPSSGYRLLQDIATIQNRDIKLKGIMFGGEALDYQRISQLQKFLPHINLYNLYGITEITVHATYIQFNKNTCPHNVGATLPGSQIVICDNNHQPLPKGFIGELVVISPGVSSGYFENITQTNERFIQLNNSTAYCSGDLGWQLNSGEIIYCGRADQQVKLRGYRIELDDIHHHLCALSDISQAVVGIHPEKKELVAFLSTHQTTPPNNSDIITALAKNLPEYMLPKQFVWLDQLPLTKNHKVDFSQLMKKNTKLTVVSNTNPRSVIEKQLMELWQTVLETNDFTLDTHFFLIGGNSLTAMRICQQLSCLFNRDIGIMELYQYPTITQLGQYLSTKLSPLSVDNTLTSFLCLNPLQKQFYASMRHFSMPELEWIELQFNNVPVIDSQRIIDVLTLLYEQQPTLRQVISSIDDVTVKPANAFVSSEHYFDHDSLKSFQKLHYSQYQSILTEPEQPLWRVHVIRENDCNILLFQWHHLIMDGYSVELFLQQLSACYSSNRSSILPQHPNLNALIDDDTILVAGNFVKGQLGEVGKTLLPKCANRPPNTQGVVQRWSLNEAQITPIKIFCKQHACSPNIPLAYLLGVTITQFFGLDHIGLLMGVNCRTELGGWQTMGYFINLIPLIVNLNEIDHLSEAIRYSITQILNQKKSTTIPLSKLSKLLSQEQLSALQQVLFLFQDETQQLSLDGKTYHAELAHTNSAKYPFTFSWNGLYELTVEYQTEFCNASMLEQFIDQYIANFKHLTNSISEVNNNLSTAIVHGMATTWVTSYNFSEQLAHQVGQVPQKIATICDNETYTYSDLVHLTRRIAYQLSNNYNIKAQDLIGCYFDRGIDSVATIYAIWQLGAVYVCLDPAWPNTQLESVLTTTQLKYIITNQNQLPVTASQTEWITVRQLSAHDHCEYNYAVLQSDDPAYVLFTSGTTGTPKGCVNTFGGLRNRLEWMINELNFSMVDVFLHKTPLTFDVSLWELIIPGIIGATQVIVPPRQHLNVDHINELITKHQINVLHFVPSLLTHFIDNGFQDTLYNLQRLILSGEACTIDLIKAFHTINPYCHVYNLYGPTEAAIDVSSYQIDFPKATIHLGKPITNTSLAIVHPTTQRLLSTYYVGEIAILGIGVGNGYLHASSLTEQKFKSLFFDAERKVYLTGDLGWIDDDKCLHIVGRKDRQIKIGGYRLELAAIEQAILSYPHINRAYVTYHDKQLSCAIDTPSIFELTDLRAYLAMRLPKVAIPKNIKCLDHWPLTANGKLDGKKMQKTLNQTASTLITHLRQLLDSDHIMPSDNFFTVGGDSIVALQLSARLAKEGFQVTVNDILTHEILADIPVTLKSLVNRQQTSSNQHCPILPTQMWYFEHVAPHPLIQVAQFSFACTGSQDEVVHKLNTLLYAYPMLCAQFHKRFGQVNIKFSSFTCEPLIKWLPKNEHTKFIDAASQQFATPYQQPLVQFAIDQSSSHIIITIVAHHLLVDFISWQIINRALTSLFSGKKCSFPVQNYHRLSDYYEQKIEQFDVEEHYWVNLLSTINAFPIVSSSIKPDSLRLILDHTQYQSLIPSKPMQANYIALLITLLHPWLSNHCQQDQYLIDIEQHGRDENTADYIGWFTSISPLAVDLSDVNNITQSVCQSMLETPEQGRHFLLAKYYLDHPVITNYPGSGLLINFLGQLTSQKDTLSFPSQPIQLLNNTVIVNAWLCDEALNIDIIADSKTIADIKQFNLIRELSSLLMTTYSGHYQRRLLPVEQQLVHMNDWLDWSQTTISNSYLLDRELDIEKYQCAWKYVINHTAVLRQYYRANKSIRAVITDKIDCIPMERLPKGSDYNIHTPINFDLEKAPLFKLTLVEIESGQHRLIWQVHHALLDGWSMSLILERVWQVYVKGVELECDSDVFFQYQQWLDNRSKLPINMQFDVTKVPVQKIYHPLPFDQHSIAPNYCDIKLSFADSEQLRNRAKQQKCSLTAIIFNEYAQALLEFWQLSSACFTTTCSGRFSEFPESLQLCGNFLNTLPVIVDTGTTASMIAQQLNHLNEQPHRSLTQLFKHHNIKPDIISHFVYENIPDQSQFENGTAFNEFPLTCTVTPAASIELRLSFNQTLLSQETVERIASQLWKRFSPFQNIMEVLLSNGQLNPEKIIVGDPNKQLTHRDFFEQAYKLANWLQQQDVKPHDRVVIALDRSCDYMVAFFAVWCCGASVIPTNNRTSKARLNTLCHIVQPKFILDKRAFHKFNCTSTSTLTKPITLSGEDEAYVIFTSGTTGEPKAVPITHDNIYHYCVGLQLRLNLSEKYRWLHVTDLAADLGYTALFMSWFRDGTLYIPNNELLQDPEQLVKWSDTLDIDIYKITPSYLAALLKVDASSRLMPNKAIILGGEIVNETLIEQLWTISPTLCLINHYGPTENTIGSCAHIISQSETDIPIGKPLAHVNTVIDDNILYLAGKQLTSGYLGDDKSNAFKLIDNIRYFCTHDIVSLNQDGDLICHGRNDDIIKWRGYRIALNEITNAALKINDVDSAKTLFLNSTTDDAFLCLYVVTQSDISSASVLDELATTLPSYALPKKIIITSALPLTDNGKVDTEKLISKVQQDNSIDDRDRSDELTINTMRPIWQKILHCQVVHDDDSFYALGGDSIAVINMLTILRQKFNIRVKISDLLTHPTLSQFTKVVISADTKQTSNVTINSQPCLTPIQTIFTKIDNTISAVHRQGVSLTLSDQIDVEQLRHAAMQLAKKHPLLRLQFPNMHSSEATLIPMPRFKFGLLPNIVQQTTSLEVRLVEHTWNFWLIIEDNQCKIIILCHHVLVDTFSWQQLISDLCYFLQNPSASTSLNEDFSWQHSLNTWLEDNALQHQNYWLSVLFKIAKMKQQKTIQPLINDGERSVCMNTTSFSYDDGFSLAQHLQLSLEQLLLLAFTQSITDTLQQTTLAITVESHGRPEHLLDNQDHLVGWNTSYFPLVINCNSNDTSLNDNAQNLLSLYNALPDYGPSLMYLIMKGIVDWTDLPSLRFNFAGIMRAQTADITLEPFDIDNTNNKSTPIINIDCFFIQEKLQCQIRGDINPVVAKKILTCWEGRLCQWRTSISKQKYFEPTATQLGMLVALKQSQQACLYNVVRRYEFNDTDVPSLMEAFSYVFRHHDIYQMQFLLDEEVPKLTFNQLAFPSQKIIDISQHKYTAQATTISEHQHMLKNHAFDLECGPLAILNCFLTDEQCCTVLWAESHLITDGWTQSLLMQEVFDCYHNLINKEPVDTLIVPKFCDYLQWYHNQGHDLSYWEQYYKHAPMPLLMSTLNPSITHGVIASYECTLEHQQCLNIQQLAQDHNVAINSVLQCAFAILLQRYCHQDEVTYGIVSSGRSVAYQDAAKLAGPLLSVFPITLKFNKDSTISEQIKAIHQHVMHQLDEPIIGLDKILSIINNDQESGGVIFDCLFILENYPKTQLHEDVKDYPRLSVASSLESTEYALNFIVTITDTIHIKIIYQQHLFSDRQIEQFAQVWQHIISTMCTANVFYCADISPLSQQSAKHLIEKTYSQQTYPRELNAEQNFYQWVKLCPHTPALIDLHNAHTYEELNERANALAYHLLDHGCRADEAVGIMLPRSSAPLIALLGVLKINCHYVMLDADIPAERLDFIINNASIKLVISDDQNHGKLKNYHTIKYGDIKPHCLLPNLSSTALPSATACILYTSGTTGRPKGIMLPHLALSKPVIATRGYSYQQSDRIAQVFNLACDGANYEIWSAWCHGACLVVIDEEVKFTARALSAAFTEFQVNVSFLPTGLFCQLFKSYPYFFESLRMQIVGGEAFPKEIACKIVELNLHNNTAVINGYGPAENGTISAAYRVNEDINNFSSTPIGRPLYNTGLILTDQYQHILPQGAIGEVLLYGDSLFNGYLNLPERNSSVLENLVFSNHAYRCYHTGDLARYYSVGYLQYIARKDQQIKIRGYRVEVDEVILRINQYPGIKESVALPIKKSSGVYFLYAFVTSDNLKNNQTTQLQIKFFLLDLLPEYMVPAQIEIINKFPITANGKVDYRQLNEMISRAKDNNFCLEKSNDHDLMKLIRDCWEKHLPTRASIDLSQHFFDLGGFSLAAMAICTELGHALEIDIPMSWLLTNPTLQEFLNILELQQHKVPSILEENLEHKLSGATTKLQFSYWLASQMYEQNAYTVISAWQLSGLTSRAHLIAALEATIDYFPELKLTFKFSDNLEQHYNPELKLSIKQFDWSNEAPAQQKQLLEQHLAQLGKTEFQLDKGPLCHFGLIQLSDSCSAFYCLFHHILIDGYGLKQFFQILQKFYAKELPPQRTTFTNVDNATLQQLYLKSSAREDAKTYWQQLLEPISNQDPLHLGQRYEKLTQPPKLFKTSFFIKHSFSDSQTPFSEFLALWAKTLSYLDNRFIIGTVLNHRSRTNNQLLSPFADLIPIVFLSDNSHEDYLSTISRQLNSARQFPHWSFADTITLLGVEAGIYQQPLIQIVFNYEEFTKYDLDLDGCTCEAIECSSQYAKYALQISIKKHNDSFYITLETPEGVVTQNEVNLLIEKFQHSIEQESELCT